MQETRLGTVGRTDPMVTDEPTFQPRRWLVYLGVASSLCGAILACNTAPTGPSPDSGLGPGSVAFIVVSGTNLFRVGTAARLTAFAYAPSGPPLDVTTRATWQTSDSAVVSVSASGIARAFRIGAATISATFRNATYTLPISVVQPMSAEAMSRYTGVWSGIASLTCQRLIGTGRDLCMFPIPVPIQLSLSIASGTLTETLSVYPNPTSGSVQGGQVDDGAIAFGGTLRPAGDEASALVQLVDWRPTLTSADQLSGTVTQDDAFINVNGPQLLRDQLVGVDLVRR
jgi:hypothetical protein